VTNDLLRRVYEHKNNLIEGFTSKYQVHQLVYYETTLEVTTALRRRNNSRNGNELGQSNSLRKIIFNG
jgi:putative endonuclease